MKKRLNLLTIAGMLTLSTNPSMANGSDIINEYGHSLIAVDSLILILNACPTDVIASVAENIHFLQNLDEAKSESEHLISETLGLVTKFKKKYGSSPLEVTSQNRPLRPKLKEMCANHEIEITDAMLDDGGDTSCTGSLHENLFIECILKEYSLDHLKKIQELNAQLRAAL